jgi:DNA-binding GntR family transcriptional regulator
MCYERIRLLDGTPVAVLQEWLGPRVADRLTAHALDAGELYTELRTVVSRTGPIDYTIASTLARVGAARALQVSPTAAALTLHAIVHDDVGQGLLVAHLVYDATRHAITVRREAEPGSWLMPRPGGVRPRRAVPAQAKALG